MLIQGFQSDAINKHNARITGASKVKTTYGNNIMSNEQNSSDAKAHPVDTLVINAEAPTVKKIWISKNIDRSELRIDWSNDRHQAILLKGDTPTATNKLNAELKDLESELAGIYVADNKCMCTNCDNRATHIWSGFNVCDACGAPGRRRLR